MDALAALLPSLGVLALFVLVVRKMIGADRDERAAQARLEAEERRRARDEAAAPRSGEDADRAEDGPRA